jgi:glycosyltransferase involved in cell wall biosynthesis
VRPMPARVLVLIDSLRVGGAETVAVVGACGVDRRRFHPHVLVTRDGGPLERQLVEAGVPYTILGRRRRLSPRAYRRAVALARESDVLHAHKLGSAVWGALLARTAHTPLVVHDHNWSAGTSRVRALGQRRWIAPVAQRVLCVSQSVADRAVREGFHAGQVEVLENGVEPVRALPRAAARRALGLSPDRFVIGTVAGLRPEKGHDVLLRALARVARDGHQPTVCAVGAGAQLPRLRDLAARLGVADRVVWAGERPDAARLLGAFDVAVLASRWEGLPLAALEALHAGVPLVAAEVGGLAEALPRGAALFFPGGDHEALAESLAQVIEQPDEAAARALGARRLARERYGGERMARGLEAAYSQALGRAAASGATRGRRRPRQGVGQFVPGEPERGYYSDLRGMASASLWARAARDGAESRIEDAVAANPVSALQLGLGAWQLTQSDAGWERVVELVACAVVDSMDARGRLAYRTPMPHTYRLSPPWFSAMAQGQAASLLVRAAVTCGRPELLTRALDATRSLTEPPLVAHTDEGPVLQEYPTAPPAHVLNGWIFALWGLYDVAPSCEVAARAFHEGVDALARRLPLYEARPGWSRYDLYPHRLANVASPFYHRLHLAQLEVMAALVPDEPAFARTAERWGRALGRPLDFGGALARKVAFRVVVPRSRTL